MSTESGAKPKPKYDPSLIDAAIKRAQEQAGTTPAAKAEKKAKEKAEKAPKGQKPDKAAKAPKEKPQKPEKGPAHLNKVEKAAAGLPALTQLGQDVMDVVNGTYAAATAGELSAIAAHLSHKARVMMTAGAVGAKLTVGALVEILPGDKGSEKYVGRKGRLTEVRNIRCFADVFDPEGNVIKKGLYLFTSGVKVIEEAEPEADDDEGEEEAKDAEATAIEGPAGADAKEFPADPPVEAEATPDAGQAPEATGTEG